ncbi:DUF167 domain-containing protein [Candidatus Nitrosotenuis aquarius]|uniref:DUF167 domain-containing protein n=1 Tax=Candidatus Nitrosotenuis aquarius TaxID=1846278 RepID=UPI000C1E3D7E|nr:DUF167 domain-containing protein [Candidatus Nitrosotenuis aquarius]
MRYTVSIVFRQDFVEIVGNHITIGVTAKPVGGAANKEIIKKLAKHFGVSSANITIKSGHKSKEKIVDIV